MGSQAGTVVGAVCLCLVASAAAVAGAPIGGSLRQEQIDPDDAENRTEAGTQSGDDGVTAGPSYQNTDA